MTEEYQLTEEEIALFWEPARSKEELAAHMAYFLHIELPDCIVDENSTSSPMQFIWDVYSYMSTGKGQSRHVVASSRNCYKCLAEGTLVATPQGPKKIEDFKIGDVVYDEFGKEIKVIGVWDQGEQECVELINNRKVWAVCTPNHIWSATKNNITYADRKTSDIKNRWKIKRIDLTQPLGTIDDPYAYVLGALFGDGCSTECGIRISSENDIIPNKIASILNTTAIKLNSKNYSYIIKDPRSDKLKHSTRWLFSEFYENNLRNKRSYEKTIDINYLKKLSRNSLLNFVAGLIDTDGSVYRNNAFNKNQININFITTSESASNAISYIFETLWQIKPLLYIGKTKKGTTKYYSLVSNNFFCKKILKELSPFLAIERKKYKPEYNDLLNNNFSPNSVGFKINPIGKRKCWDLTVDSETSLYCLQNGLVTHNTLATSLIQFYNIIHIRRDSVQISAELQQSASALAYVEQFLKLPHMDRFREKDNTKVKRLHGLPSEYNWLTKRTEAVLKVVTASIKGANSSRASCIIFDETDLISPKAIAESAYISDPDRWTGFDPVTIYISSRKSNSGPLQNLIDEYDKEKPEDLKLHLWSTVDIMRKCPEDICDSTKPAKAFMHNESLDVIWGEDRFAALVKDGQTAWKEINAFEDCAKCPAFIACQGRSKKQTGAQSTLRTNTFVGKVLKDVLKAGGPSTIIAQTLNLKPDTSSIVFNNFNAMRNVAEPINFYKWICGSYFTANKYSQENINEILYSGNDIKISEIIPTKLDIYNLLKAHGWRIHYGIDFGLYDPAVVIVLGYHRTQQRCAILHVEASSGYPNEDWAKYVHNNVYTVMPSDLVCPDMADASAPIYFGRLKMQCRNKKPMSIETGVNQLKSLIYNPFTKRADLMILDDGEYGQNKVLIESFEKWTYRKTATGFDFNKFEDNEYTHTLDATRYSLDPFITETKISYGSDKHVLPEFHEIPRAAALGNVQAQEFIKKKMQFEEQFKDMLADEHGIHLNKHQENPLEPSKKNNGGIKFKF